MFTNTEILVLGLLELVGVGLVIRVGYGIRRRRAVARTGSGSTIACLIIASCALFSDLCVLPAFYVAVGEFSNSGRPGLVVTAVMAIASVFAFFRCPNRPLLGKFLVTILMAIVLSLAVHQWLVQAMGILY